MAVVVPLDSRQASITRLLLTEKEPATVEAIASDLKLTSRVVRYNLPSIETFLRPEGLRVMRRRGVGIWVSGDDERRRAILTSLGAAAGPRVLDGEGARERRARLRDPARRDRYGAHRQEAGPTGLRGAHEDVACRGRCGSVPLRGHAAAGGLRPELVILPTELQAIGRDLTR